MCLSLTAAKEDPVSCTNIEELVFNLAPNYESGRLRSRGDLVCGWVGRVTRSAAKTSGK